VWVDLGPFDRLSVDEVLFEVVLAAIVSFWEIMVGPIVK
jgi:hypothetical protein